MRTKSWMRVVAALAALVLLAAACGDDDDTAETTEAPTATTAATTTTQAATSSTASTEGFKFGMILVGPSNDHGWSQAHYEAGRYLEAQLGATMIVAESINVADSPSYSVDQAIDDMVADGAQLIFATSDDMRDGVEMGAANHPDIPMIWSSGDSAWPEAASAYRPDLTNLGNTMGRMEYGKAIAGCAAALTTQTGSIGYLGPLINDETRRLANSVYLGALYCWENYRDMDPGELTFSVNWIGFWFNIPGVTLDPTQVANDFFDGGADVVVSGIDTTQALVVAGQLHDGGETVWAIPYDFEGACAEAPEVCLGVPYFNWAPAYERIINSVVDGTFQAEFEWFGPNWADLNGPESGIGFEKGEGLSAENGATLDEFIAGLGDGSIQLWTGPLNYQDGTPWLAAGETASDAQLWFTKQLLEGMIGASSAE